MYMYAIFRSMGLIVATCSHVYVCMGLIEVVMDVHVYVCYLQKHGSH